MSYETKYTLAVNDHGESKPQCLHAVDFMDKYCPFCGERVRKVPLSEYVWESISHDERLGFALGNGSHEGAPCKWNEWEADMRLISRAFPTVFFTLRGAGSDAEDRWEAYFLNGKMQKSFGRIVFDAYDPKKMS